jgi:hypothetical protein
MARRNKREHAARHVRLYHYITNGAAWHDLNPVARAIYIEIAKRYAGVGSNNGRIPYSVREAAKELKIGPATASRALATLVDHGFIVPVTKGAFSRKNRHATEWRLTEFPCDVTNTPIGTKDFMRWEPPSPHNDQQNQSITSSQHRQRAQCAAYPLAN